MTSNQLHLLPSFLQGASLLSSSRSRHPEYACSFKLRSLGPADLALVLLLPRMMSETESHTSTSHPSPSPPSSSPSLSLAVVDHPTEPTVDSIYTLPAEILTIILEMFR